MNRINLLIRLVLAFLPAACAAQSPPYPICNRDSSNPNFAYFETAPSSGAPWNICIRSIPCEVLSGTFPPPEISVNGEALVLNATFRRQQFGVCTQTVFFRITLPQVAGPTITVRYSTRGSFEFNPDQPYFFRQEITAGVISLAPAPSLNSWGVLGLVGLILIGAFAVRQR
jgi:hypothetical protein